jgi:threonylcarbamoyladenosine tRNA methylthiotransferase MtaB
MTSSEVKESKNIITLGCRLNDSESEIISNHLKNLNLNDVIVVNTCSVTETAKKESVQRIKEIIKNNNDLPENLRKKVYVTGCAVQLDPDRFVEIPGIERVIGNMDKLDQRSYESEIKEKKIWRTMFGQETRFKPLEILEKSGENELIKKQSEKIFIKNEIQNSNGFLAPNITKLEGKTRGLIQIQNGCNHDCTFCVIYMARGKNRSIPPLEILKQIKILLENGYKEIILTGVDITDYGLDLNEGQINLAKLIKKILNAFDGKLERLRLSSIDVAEIDDELFETLAYSKKILPYFHLSLQSGNDLILKRMKRRHTRAQIINFCLRMIETREDVVFGADIIAGFPTETDELFNDTLNLIKEIPNFIHLHIFSFSAHSETPSAKMPQVDSKIIKQRAKILREAGLENRLKFYEKVLKSENFDQNVLFESESSGYTEQFLQVKLIKNEFEKNLQKGQIRKVKLLEIIEDKKKTLQPFYFLGKISNF